MENVLYNTIVHIMSKVIRDCCDFALRSVIGVENLHHSLDQSDARLKAITSWSPAFSCALGNLLDFTLRYLLLRYFPSSSFSLVLVKRHSIEKRSKLITKDHSAQ